MRKIWMGTAVLAGFACAVPASAQQRVWQGGRWTGNAGSATPPAVSGIGAPPRMTPGHATPPRPGNFGNPRPGGNIATPPRPGGNWGNNPPRPGGNGGNNPPRPGGNWGNNPPRPGGHIGTPPRPNHARPPRWQMNNGRWIGGWQAPGGWNAYRRLNRGAHLPAYWRGSNFRIHDYASFGLFAPPQGYFWMRYYDDAILADEGGRVWDSYDGIGWDVDGYDYADGGWSESYAGVGGGYVVPPAGPYYDAPPTYAAPAPYPGGYAPSAPVVQVVPAQGGAYGSYYGAGGYAASSYAAGGYYGGGTTTVVITPAPVTTTTVVEEIVEEEVSTSYVRTAPKRMLRKAPVRRYKKPSCVC